MSAVVCVAVGLSVQYFKDLVVTNTGLLEGLAAKWDDINSDIPDDMEEGNIIIKFSVLSNMGHVTPN